jgi:ATP-binding cassette subfamily F protein 3
VQVRQEIAHLDQPLLEFVLSSDGELMSLRRRLEGDLPAEESAELYEALGAMDGFSAESRAAAILCGLGFTQSDLRRPLGEFSGGWQVRASLAATLFAPSNCLLLDEPTNHLDLETALWLENHLQRSNRTLLLISHEKDFLNVLCDKILHIYAGEARLYAGNYDSFRRTEAEQRQGVERMRAADGRKREHLQEFVDRFRAKATKARQVQSRLKALEKIEKLPPPPPAYEVAFSFPTPHPEVDRRLVTLEDVSLGYGGDAVLRGVNFHLDLGRRVALLGANGNGKSTLAKAVAGRLQPTCGTISRVRRLCIAYFSQQQADELDLQQTPLQLFEERTGERDGTKIRTALAGFGLTQARCLCRTGLLSGGERTRLLLALLCQMRPHLLILDEPTNHLDIEAREALVPALQKFRGAVLLVTHDFHVLSAVAEEFHIIAGGRCERYRGSAQQYRSWLLGGNGGADASRLRKMAAMDGGAFHPPRSSARPM